MTRSIRNFLGTHNLLAVSARLKEASLNQEQTLDTGMLVDLNTVLNYRASKFPNREELTGKEEADRLHYLGGTVGGTLAFSRAQPQHFAFLLAYGLGDTGTASLGASGYRHTIRPRSGEVDEARSNPSFTAAMRYGKQVRKRRFASCFIDQVRVELAKDGWAKLNGVMKGTGKVTDNTLVEQVAAPFNANSLSLAANGVEGADAGERFANVQAVQVLSPTSQAWEDVNYSAVSGATPAVVSITAPGGTGTSVAYKIYYIPQESGWMVLPARVEEPPLKVSQTSVNLGGRWNGSSFVGGHTLASDLRRLVWTLNNHLTPERTPGAGTDYANRAFRGGREQKLDFDRDFRDFLLAQHLEDNDTLGIYVKATGPEFETGVRFQVELVFPKVGVLQAPVKIAQRRLVEEVQFAVLEDDTYGSVCAFVQNQVSSYAA